MTPLSLDAAAAALLSWLLTYAIHSTLLLAIAALAARRLAEHHAWLDLIWKTAVIAPLLTASLNLDPVAAPVGRRWAVPATAPVTSPAAVALAEPAPAPAAVAKEATPASRVDRPVTRPAMIVSRWPVIAATVWLAIAMAAVARYCVRLRRVYTALGSGSPITKGELILFANELRQRALQRHPVRLAASAPCPVPLALAGRRIVVPERFLDELDPEQQRAALAHEMAHVARRDPEWRIAIDLLERALFFQPLIRLARARLSDAAEFLCDEWAVRQTESPLALARCLSTVASWWSPADTLPAGVSAMARSDSAMVRRVTRILDTPAPIARPRWYWLAVPVALVAVAAPRVTATQLPAAAVAPAEAAMVTATLLDTTAGPRPEQRQWTPADVTAARAQLRDYRAGGTLDERWRRALADAGKQGFNDFWIVYTFTTPTHADDVIMTDTREGSFVSADGRLSIDGPPLTALLNRPAVPLEGGQVAVLLHYRGARADAIDRASYRSIQLGFDFGRAPVFWIGDAPEAESFARVQNLFGQARTERIQIFMIELASIHSDSNAVIPFLAGFVDQKWPAAIRSEAAEGFDHHHDPRSVEILLRVARTDPESSVRAEAAETIGEVQTPQSIPALNELARESTDSTVRHEAAEAFADQPAAQALPALESLIATTNDAEVLNEAIEAIGELGDAAGVPLLVDIANRHPRVDAQREAVETLGDMDDPAALTALEAIAREHYREDVQAEAIETLADGPEEAVHPLILELAVSGRSAHIRREALDAIGDAVSKVGDPQQLDRVEAVLERVIFDDPDRSVGAEALDALEHLPRDRELRLLRKVIESVSDARLRREAAEKLRERQ